MLKPGDKIVLCGFGGGLTWGAHALSWQLPTPEIKNEDSDGELIDVINDSETE